MLKLQKNFRLYQWVILAVALTIALAFIAPEQLGILVLKATYVSTALVIGYWADRIIFYYARPHDLGKEAWREIRGHVVKDQRVESAYRAYSLSMLRRAIIVAAVVIAFALGL